MREYLVAVFTSEATFVSGLIFHNGFAGMSSRQRARTAEELLSARQLPPLPDIADAPPIGLADLYRDSTQKG